MRAATVLEFNKPLQILDVPIPTPASDQILVRVLASSLCNSDIAGWMGVVGAVAPYCPGHEPVGIIEAIGSSVKGFAKGDRVGFMPASSICFDCNDCIAGNHRFCEKKTSVGFKGPYGGFSEFCLADPLSTVKIPDALTNESAAPLLCAGVTAYAALKKVSQFVTGGKTINVIGCGGVGHLVIMYAKEMGYGVHAFDVAEDKLQLARDSGADKAYNTATLADGGVKQANATVVSSGATSAYDLAFKLTQNHGRIIAIGVPRGDISVNILEMVRHDLSLIATNQGTKQELAEALEIAATHNIKPCYEMRELEQINEGFQDMLQGKIAGRLVYRMG
ncbi:hypothetical protein AJ79_09816 [Helicocarpus griseus UAMH5409]|uniref:Enoyl reductase (ER) domain-containing protein n=1 Tax=Helicocarpus griseus UAMH5409 TaxID=1447875 RepID=A0A2B7WGX1_9EURO|nr:hypothetical protein AJ79_09816 [Helicocarpus griseus UAMH5409]